MFEPLVAELDAGIRIHFDKPDMAGLVEHEIVAENLEVLYLVRVGGRLMLVHARAARDAW